MENAKIRTSIVMKVNGKVTRVDTSSFEDLSLNLWMENTKERKEKRIAGQKKVSEIM